MKEPAKIIPKGEEDYLRVMTRAVFQAGFNWKVIENKWAGFEAAFDHFDPAKVAGYNPSKISELKVDLRIVRNGSKIEATVHNAQKIIEKSEEYGSFKAYLDSFKGFEETVMDIKKTFKWIGDFAGYYFLYVVNQPVPSHEDWSKSRGIKIQGP